MLRAVGIVALQEELIDGFGLPAQDIVLVFVCIDNLLEVVLPSLDALDEVLVYGLRIVVGHLEVDLILRFGRFGNQLVNLAHQAPLALLDLLVGQLDF